jgi:hypothetical protein
MVKSADTFQPTIPARVVIGVTGHRKLDNEPALAEQVQRILERIKLIIPLSPKTPLVFTILSPLAEGADRLVAREVLKISDSQLEVVLPLDKDDYLRDFESSESKAEFEQLLAQARRVKPLPAKLTRTEAYAQVGRYVVDHCDVLIALWNGKPAAGQGGTAEIVDYARAKKCPLYWIHTADAAEVTSEQESGLSLRTFQDLDHYNSEPLDPAEIRKQVANEHQRLIGHAEKVRFPVDQLQRICDQVLPHYARSDLLSLRYQRLYFKAGSWVYALAAAAVAVVTFQAFFLAEQPKILLIEVVFMIIVLVIIGLGNRRRWHSKWIDYRFLAERFRSAVFMAVANLEVGTLRPPRHLSLAYSSKDWMVAAFTSVWSQLPRFSGPDPAQFKALRELLLKAWIEDQIRYHHNTSQRHRRRHHRLEIAGNILFGLTFVAAVLHVVHFGPDLFQNLLTFMAITLPAIGAALGAIRTHREYLRNAERSAEMVRHLKELKDQMQEAESLESFLPLVREAEETMLHENEDWRVVVRFHKPELPA